MGRRYGRRNPEKYVDSYLQEGLKRKVNDMMENRHKILAPFPVDPMALYDLLYTPEQHHAIGVLSRMEGLLREERSILVTVEHPEAEAETMEQRYKVWLPKPMPMSGDYKSLSTNKIPEDLRVPLQQWDPIWRGFRAETNRLLVKVEALGKQCATWGQAHRLWPDLLGFFSDEGQEKIASMKVRSPYPQDVLDGDGNLIFGYRPEDFAPFTSMLAECLMLPEIDLKHVAEPW